MKNTKILLLLLVLIAAPIYSQQMTLADSVIAAQKKILNIGLDKKVNLKKSQKALLTKLGLIEESFFNKRNIASNFDKSPTILYTDYVLKEAQKDIDYSKDLLKKIKDNPKSLKYGLIRLSYTMSNEQKYLTKLTEDFDQTIRNMNTLNQGNGPKIIANYRIMLQGIALRTKLMEYNYRTKKLYQFNGLNKKI